MWTWLGTTCGAGLGFITANGPGLVAGASAGARLGANRDAKGKSVAAVFAELGTAQKVEVRRNVLGAGVLEFDHRTPWLQILRVLCLKVLGAVYT